MSLTGSPSTTNLNVEVKKAIGILSLVIQNHKKKPKIAQNPIDMCLYVFL